MAAAGDLHQRERAPGHDEQTLARLPAAPKERAQGGQRRQLAAGEEELHGGHGVVHRDHAARGELPERGVDRGVVLVVHASPRLSVRACLVHLAVNGQAVPASPTDNWSIVPDRAASSEIARPAGGAEPCSTG